MRDITGRYRSAMDRQDSWMAYEVESIEDITTTEEGDVETTTEYIRYEDKGSDPCGILRTVKTKIGNKTTTRITWVYAPWAERTTAEYQPVNECWNAK